MLTMIFCLVILYSALIVHGVPVDVLITPPQRVGNKNEPPYRGMNPKLLGGGFQGDMLFPDGFDPTKNSRGVAIYGDDYRWPHNTIPYDISAITVANDRQKIIDAMHALMYAVGTPISGSNHRTACVYFRPRESSDRAYLEIKYGIGCSAHVGHMNGYQSVMTLQQSGCFYSGTIQHELMHVIGFHHEQCRPDRDNYVKINSANIEDDKRFAFDKYAWGSTVYNQGTSYDYGSIMHYETNAFSKNGKPTIIPRQAGVTIGTTEKLSLTDIFEVRHLYRCNV